MDIHILIAYITLQTLNGTVRLSVPQGDIASKNVPTMAQINASAHASTEQIHPIINVPKNMATKQAADPSYVLHEVAPAS